MKRAIGSRTERACGICASRNPRNPFAPSGYQQLVLMGIEVAAGQFQSTVEVMSAGWQLGLTWQLPSAE
ncbi:hypothetical protein [Gloeobacter kilaueensis]|uniref:hypothetical protein n=1 Tax=Gloeobacter kilaueensis TaxID=1416614 RepID=UPI001183DB67|nr:hypothetical protein [Gloeobacter kilaueensis]